MEGSCPAKAMALEKASSVARMIDVSKKTMKVLTIDHSIKHAAQEVDDAAHQCGVTIQIKTLVQQYHELCGEMTVLQKESTSVKTGGNTAVIEGLEEKEATSLKRLHECETEKEWLRNLIIDLELGKHADISEHVHDLKEVSRNERTTASALRLRFNAIKGCKNFLQGAKQLLLEQIKSLEHEQKQANQKSTQSTAERMFARIKSCVSPRAATEKRRGVQAKTAIQQNLNQAAALIFRAYFLLPSRARMRHQAEVLRSIDLPWLNENALDDPWRDAASKWKGSFQKKENIRKSSEAMMMPSFLEQLQSVVAQVEKGIQILETFKVEIKGALEIRHTSALNAEHAIIDIRDNLFAQHECSIVGTSSSEDPCPFDCRSQLTDSIIHADRKSVV